MNHEHHHRIARSSVLTRLALVTCVVSVLAAVAADAQTPITPPGAGTLGFHTLTGPVVAWLCPVLT